jgi:hypothetical protein
MLENPSPPTTLHQKSKGQTTGHKSPLQFSQDTVKWKKAIHIGSLEATQRLDKVPRK